MKRWISVFIFVSLIAFIAIPSANAHNIRPSNAFRWEYAAYNATYGHKVIRLQANGDNLVANWNNQLTAARANWNMNSDNYVNAVNWDFSSSTVDLATRTTWPVEWGTNNVAITLLFNNGTDITGSSAAMNTVDYAQIWTNPAYNTNLTNYMYRLILVHEMGHVMGLGHPPEGTVSVMTQSQTSWEFPQAHDRTDLTWYYSN